ncbi:MAG: WG repeat-containing protein, partial [Chitinophagaceae bacterium]
MKEILIISIALVLASNSQSQKIVPCRCEDKIAGLSKYGYCDSLRTKYIIQCQFDSAYPLTNGLGRIIKDGKIG